MRAFRPLVRNPHLLTIASNFWPRRLDVARFPVQERLFATEPGVQVLVHSQYPKGDPRAQLVLSHGLEGSSQGGYMRSMAQSALEAGYAVHRVNTRGCGGSERLCCTLYHAGLTIDLRRILEVLHEEARGPLVPVGYSLGGNVILKLAGEMAEGARALVAGVCAVSTPIDLAASVRRLGALENRIYEGRFLSRMKQRQRARHRHMPDRFPIDRLREIRSVFEFDDLLTAPSFGLGNARNYYATQSALRFVDGIRVPTLVVQAKDDPLIPFEAFERAPISTNPFIELLAVEHGGHLGFLARKPGPRFWVDHVVLDWVDETLNSQRDWNKRHSAIVF